MRALAMEVEHSDAQAHLARQRKGCLMDMDRYTLERVLRQLLVSHYRPSYYITVDKTAEPGRAVLYWGDDSVDLIHETPIETWDAFWGDRTPESTPSIWTNPGVLNVQALLGIAIVIKEADDAHTPSQD